MWSHLWAIKVRWTIKIYNGLKSLESNLVYLLKHNLLEAKVESETTDTLVLDNFLFFMKTFVLDS